jgi:glycosyltransferase involved in cell wall biosynthesis
MTHISVISPVYKAENILDELVKRITSEIEKITSDYEIILVEDGSPDNSWQKIKENCAKNDKVKGIKLSRNFGQHYAVTAGIENSFGEYLIIMDCDLQDDPIFIKQLIYEAQNGNDIVYTKRKKRAHSFSKSMTSKIYNLLFTFFANKEYDVDAGSLILFSKKVAIEFLKIKDKDRLYLQIFKWLGFKSCTVEVVHNERFEGNSSYTLIKLIKLGIQGWTSHSDKLLKLSIYLGFFIASVSFALGLSIFVFWIYHPFQAGWPSLILSIFFSTGLILMSIGILGIYIGKTFEQSKNRPLYIIDNKLNYE